MITPTVTELVRNGNHVGEPVELGRHTVPAGERILYGQRINGVVRFLGTMADVFVSSSSRSEHSRHRAREGS